MDYFTPQSATVAGPDGQGAVWFDSPEDCRRRHDMVRQQILARGIRQPRLIRAMARLPRHFFTHSHERLAAYDDHAMPSDHGQTISQPLIVAVMTAALGARPQQRILEIGTGTGYQTALLAMLYAQVFTVECVRELSIAAQERLPRLGINDVSYCIGDGSMGWEEHAPYDGILVTAGAAAVPQPLLAQLADGGRLIIPIGKQKLQMLKQFERCGQEIRSTDILECRFVPLLGEYGWQSGRG